MYLVRVLQGAYYDIENFHPPTISVFANKKTIKGLQTLQMLSSTLK